MAELDSVEDWAELQRLFHEARACSDKDRAAWMAEHCQDEAMRAQLEVLLQADDAPDDRLVGLAGDVLEDSLGVAEPPLADGRKIGSYRLTSLIAAGGMGVVYEATQEEPQRSVALKLLPVGFDAVALQRFRYESQILAHLTHPGIAHVYDSGTVTLSGRQMPWFAMELVRGAKPIDEYAREAKLSRVEVLGLFVKVCDAIHHGHQKGVIHRDLKPGNVLVGSTGEPKVIDFGIAKTTDPSMGLSSIDTTAGQVVGTLRYMSPEQAGGSSTALDTRTDVYSLGIILYELLTGEQPYPVSREDLVTSLKTIVTTPPNRQHLESARVSADLNTVVLTALDKDPERRYASAQALARDLERFMSNEPIEARPASALYQLRKFAARNRGLVFSIAGVVVALAAGSVGTTVGMLRAQHQSEVASLARDAAQGARNDAEQARDEAQWTERFLAELLKSADPWSGNASDVTVREALQNATRNLEADPPPSERAEAEVRATLGEIYGHVGEFEAAQLNLTKALALREALVGPEDERTLELERLLLMALLDGDRTREALGRSDELLARHRAVLGREAAGTLSAMNLHAELLAADGRLEESEKLHEQTLGSRGEVLGFLHADTIESASNFAVVIHNRGDIDRAVPLMLDVLDRRRKAQGDDHPQTLLAMGNLATALRFQKRYPESEKLYNEVIDRKVRILGPDHPNTLRSLSDFSMLLRDSDRPEEAEKLCRDVVHRYEARLGPKHRDTTGAMSNLAYLLDLSGKADASEKVHLELLGRIEGQPVGPHGGPVIAIGNYGRFLSGQSRHEEAAEQYRRSVALASAELGENHWLLGAARMNLGRVLTSLDRPEQAVAELDPAYELLARIRGPKSSFALIAAESLAEAHEELGHDAEAAKYRAMAKE